MESNGFDKSKMQMSLKKPGNSCVNLKRIKYEEMNLKIVI